VVQAIAEQATQWKATTVVDSLGQKVNTTAVECSRWEAQEIMGHKGAELKIWEGMEEVVQDRAILISIKTFLTEVESILEATIHHRLAEVVLEVTVLVN
jgi:hypothetical protein